MENFSPFTEPLNSKDSIKPDLSRQTLIYYICGLVLFFIFFNFLFLNAPNDFPDGTIFNINRGESLRSVSLKLKDGNFIRSRLAFEAFAILYGGEKYIISADYFFEDKLPVFELARRIAKGERHLAPVKVTIPEGFNVSEITQTFASKLPNFDQDKFLLEAKDKEGYLFPDTYFFFTMGSAADVLKSMTDNYEKKIAPLRPEIFASGKTEKEIITMASIIEKEAKGGTDREFISGILWKRLKIDMPLQVDAVPGTYKTRGLPKNPVANPGFSSIIASIRPKNSPYFYYLHDQEGNIHYAKSFAEHVNNKLKYLK